MHNLFGDVMKFISDVEDNSVTKRRLKQSIADLEARARIQIQLAVTVEFGEPFVQATYRLEGDAALCLNAYEEVSTLTQFTNTDPLQLPSTAALYSFPLQLPSTAALYSCPLQLLLRDASWLTAM